jgi:hypothetical protein
MTRVNIEVTDGGPELVLRSDTDATPGPYSSGTVVHRVRLDDPATIDALVARLIDLRARLGWQPSTK